MVLIIFANSLLDLAQSFYKIKLIHCIELSETKQTFFFRSFGATVADASDRRTGYLRAILTRYDFSVPYQIFRLSR